MAKNGAGGDVGRPTKYSEEIAAEICGRVITGVSMRTICKDESMPAPSTVFLWLSKYPAFSDQYAKAKTESIEAIADELFDIADNGSNDWIEQNADEDGKKAYKLNGENVQRSRLRVDTRKWYLSKIAPKKYGDRQELDHTSSDGSMKPTTIQLVAPNDESED